MNIVEIAFNIIEKVKKLSLTHGIHQFSVEPGFPWNWWHQLSAGSSIQSVDMAGFSMQAQETAGSSMHALVTACGTGRSRRFPGSLGICGSGRFTGYQGEPVGAGQVYRLYIQISFSIHKCSEIKRANKCMV